MGVKMRKILKILFSHVYTDTWMVLGFKILYNNNAFPS